MNFKSRLIGLSFVSILLFGCDAFDTKKEQDRKNFLYVSETVGPIILEYKQENGCCPETFGQAFSSSKKTLPNRGDYYGRGLSYMKISDDEFIFVSSGVNNEFDSGELDDLVIVYLDGQWSVGNDKDVERAFLAIGPSNLQIDKTRESRYQSEVE